MTRVSSGTRDFRALYFICPYIIVKLLSFLFLESPHPLANFTLLVMRLLSVLLLVLLSAGLGHVLLRKLHVLSECSVYNFCYAVTAGFVLTAYTVFFALIRIRGINIFLPLVFFALYLSLREISLYLQDILPRSPRWQDLGGITIGILAILCLLFLYSLYTALTPPCSWDEQVYHLQIPKIYLHNKGFSYIPLNVYSNMPLNQQLLYLAAMVIGDDVAARVLHYVMGLVVCLSLYGFSRRYLSPFAGAIAPLLFLCNPIIFSEFGIAYIDIGMALYCVWMVFSLVEFVRSGNEKYGILMGLFAGMGLGSKYTMVFGFVSGLIVLVLAPVIWINKKDPAPGNEVGMHQQGKRNFLKVLIVYVFLALVLFFPWMMKNYYYTGNPLYPAFYSVFGGRDWTPRQSSWLMDWQHSIGQGRRLTDYLLLIFRIFIPYEGPYGYRGFAGVLYPYMLLLLPLIVFIRKNRRMMLMFLLFFLVFFIQWSLGTQQIRFLIPALPLLALCSAAGVDSLKHLKLKIIPWIAIGIVLLAPLHLGIDYIYKEIKREGSLLPILAGKELRENFLRPRVRSYSCFEYLLSKCYPGEPVLFLFENRGYYCDQPYYADSMYEASHFLNLALEAGSPQELKKRLLKYNARFVVVDQDIREGIGQLGKIWILSEEQNSANYRKALDIMNRFIEIYLEQVFAENRSIVYAFK